MPESWNCNFQTQFFHMVYSRAELAENMVITGLFCWSDIVQYLYCQCLRLQFFGTLYWWIPLFLWGSSMFWMLSSLCIHHLSLVVSSWLYRQLVFLEGFLLKLLQICCSDYIWQYSRNEVGRSTGTLFDRALLVVVPIMLWNILVCNFHRNILKQFGYSFLVLQITENQTSWLSRIFLGSG